MFDTFKLAQSVQIYSNIKGIKEQNFKFSLKQNKSHWEEESSKKGNIKYSQKKLIQQWRPKPKVITQTTCFSFYGMNYIDGSKFSIVLKCAKKTKNICLCLMILICYFLHIKTFNVYKSINIHDTALCDTYIFFLFPRIVLGGWK